MPCRGRQLLDRGSVGCVWLSRTSLKCSVAYVSIAGCMLTGAAKGYSRSACTPWKLLGWLDISLVLYGRTGHCVLKCKRHRNKTVCLRARGMMSSHVCVRRRARIRVPLRACAGSRRRADAPAGHAGAGARVLQLVRRGEPHHAGHQGRAGPGRQGQVTRARRAPCTASPLCMPQSLPSA